MKLIYAKLWLRKYIKYNFYKLDNNRLNRNIINLSHRVFKSKGLQGHITRQEIRKQLQDFVKIELESYNKNWEIKNPNAGYVSKPSIFKRLLNYLRNWFIEHPKVS